MANASNLNPSGSIFPFQFVLLLYSRRLNQARLWFFQFPFVRFYFWRRKPLIHSVYVYVFFFLYFTHLIHRVQYNLINVVHSFRWATFFFFVSTIPTVFIGFVMENERKKSSHNHSVLCSISTIILLISGRKRCNFTHTIHLFFIFPKILWILKCSVWRFKKYM